MFCQVIIAGRKKKKEKWGKKEVNIQWCQQQTKLASPALPDRTFHSLISVDRRILRSSETSTNEIWARELGNIPSGAAAAVWAVSLFSITGHSGRKLEHELSLTQTREAMLSLASRLPTLSSKLSHTHTSSLSHLHSGSSQKKRFPSQYWLQLLCFFLFFLPILVHACPVFLQLMLVELASRPTFSQF